MKLGRPSRSTRRRQRGFAVIYVAAIIIFLMGIVLQGTREIRAQAKVSASLQEQAATQVRLRAAATWLLARLNLQWSFGGATPPGLWELAQGQPETLLIDGVPITITAEDAELRPDVNLLDEAGWNRLLSVYGVPKVQATELALYFLDARQHASAAGFSNIAELMESPRLPAGMVRGLVHADGSMLPPLNALMSVGCRCLRLHVSNTPVALFSVVLGASTEQMEALQRARQSRQLTVADAELILGEKDREKLYDGSPRIFSFRLKTSAPPMGLEILATIDSGKLFFGPARSL